MKWLLLVALAGACGGAHSAPARPRPAPPPAAKAPLTVAAPAGPSDAECARLVAHAVDLGVTELGAPAERAEPVRAGLQAQFATACRAMPRAEYTCAIAARSLDALAACDGYATRSSSTSNSSVAPGGITPPAPRSP